MTKDFDVHISFKYIRYSEGENSLDLDVEPETKSSTVYVPSSSTWNSAVPAWAQNRRDEILSRIKEKCAHLNWKWEEEA